MVYDAPLGGFYFTQIEDVVKEIIFRLILLRESTLLGKQQRGRSVVRTNGQGGIARECRVGNFVDLRGNKHVRQGRILCKSIFGNANNPCPPPRAVGRVSVSAEVSV